MFKKEDDLFDEYDEYGVHKGTPPNYLPAIIALILLAVLYFATR